MKRKDCAYCIDLGEQGVLCDHPLRLDCGEPVDARCSSRCADYERRMSVTEALSRIHDLEAKLAESEKYRARYADMLIPLKAENEKLRKLVHKQDALTKAVHAYWAGGEGSLDDFNVMMDANAQVLALMRELGIEVNE